MSNNNNNNKLKHKHTQKQKYRPVFSGAQLSHMYQIAKADYIQNSSQESFSVLGILSPFLAKVEAGAIIPAYVSSERVSILESLGGTSVETVMTKEQYWEACYTKYLSFPNDCSIKEIGAAKEWKYLNGLMSEEELEAFEFNSFLPPN